MYTVYVLQDEVGNRYKGFTSNLARRLEEHRKGKTRTTRRMKGIQVVYTEQHQDLEGAKKRERYLKSSAGRRFIKEVLGA